MKAAEFSRQIHFVVTISGHTIQFDIKARRSGRSHIYSDILLSTGCELQTTARNANVHLDIKVGYTVPPSFDVLIMAHETVFVRVLDKSSSVLQNPH
jgi:hypothetical protein